jgi:hypothetical protein
VLLSGGEAKRASKVPAAASIRSACGDIEVMR